MGTGEADLFEKFTDQFVELINFCRNTSPLDGTVDVNGMVQSLLRNFVCEYDDLGKNTVERFISETQS